MLVSWSWLKQYVALDMPREELEQRLMMSGLNHEGTEKVGDDVAIDLEVTSNRPDCLGHFGVAREIAVLYDLPLTRPAAAPAENGPAIDGLTSVALESPELCPRYTARLIRGVKVGPSPDWLVRHLETLGVASINNLVDITNYVLFEIGQPLHAFDFAKLAGGKIVVRAARQGEKMEAIDHKTYQLSPEMCVIADAERPVAIAGVMGGAGTEVSESTTDVLIESAAFAPLTIRGAARKLNLHSPSSFRFERTPDPEAVDWASRRCCELILELAGGELASGMIDVGTPAAAREPVTLRYAQLERLLGIEITNDDTRKILTALGCEETAADNASVSVVPPSWRRDLSREIDLVEEVARIYGYDRIPEDAIVPLAASHRSDEDRGIGLIRHVLCAAGFDEAMTPSLVNAELTGHFTTWSDAEPLSTLSPMLRGANQLRTSLLPSLLTTRQTNESLSNETIELFELANIYLPQGTDTLPEQQRMLALTSGRSYLELKGALEQLLTRLNRSLTFTAETTEHPLLEAGVAANLQLDGQHVGLIGQLSAAGQKTFGLRGPATVAELKVTPLIDAAQLIPQQDALSTYPAVERDLNFVVENDVLWAQLADAVRSSAGPYLERLEYQETYRDAKRLGESKKSVVLRMTLRRPDATLTREEADAVCTSVTKNCGESLGADLRA